MVCLGMCMGMILRLHLGGGEKPDGVCIVIVHRTHRIANGTARRTVHGTIHSIWRCIAHRTVRGMSQHPFSLTRLLLRCSIHRITHRGMRGHPAITSHRTSHHPSKDTSHRTSHRALHCRPYEKGAIFVFCFARVVMSWGRLVFRISAFRMFGPRVLPIFRSVTDTGN